MKFQQNKLKICYKNSIRPFKLKIKLYFIQFLAVGSCTVAKGEFHIPKAKNINRTMFDEVNKSYVFICGQITTTERMSSIEMS